MSPLRTWNKWSQLIKRLRSLSNTEAARKDAIPQTTKLKWLRLTTTIAPVKKSKAPTGMQLPNEVLELIIQYCSRFTLSKCCLANKALYRVAIVHLYQDPFTLDSVDHPTSSSSDIVVPHWSNADRAIKLGRTIVSTPDLTKLIMVFRNVFWDDHGLLERWWTPVLPHLANVVLVHLDGCSQAFARTKAPPVTLKFLELLCVHSPHVRRIKIKIPGFTSGNCLLDPAVMHRLSGFLYLQELDITAYKDAKDELLLVFVNTMTEMCRDLRSIRWKVKTNVSNDTLGEEIVEDRMQRFEPIDGIWSANPAANKPVMD